MKITDFQKEIKNAFDVVRLDAVVTKAVYDRKNLTAWAAIILFLPFVVNVILSSLSFPSGFSAIFSSFVFWPIFIPALSILAVMFFIGLFADKVYKAKVEYMGIFRVMSYGSIILWLSMVLLLLSFIGFMSFGAFGLISLVALGWVLYIAYNTLMKVCTMKDQAAMITVILGFFVYYLVQSSLGKILVGDFYRFL